MLNFTVFRSVTGQIHLQSGEVLLLVEEDSLQNESDGPTGSQTGQQEQPGRQVRLPDQRRCLTQTLSCGEGFPESTVMSSDVLFRLSNDIMI